MAITKTIVCLANSRKLSGRCLAGKEFDGSTVGGWLRPVSGRSSEEVSEAEREYQDGSDPCVLDIVQVPLIEARPKTFQSENWLLDAQHYWARKGKLAPADLLKFCDHPAALWANHCSTSNGLNDQVPEAIADSFDTSLYLLDAGSVVLHVFDSGGGPWPKKRKVQARFKHNGIDYWLSVTDPEIEKAFKPKADGTYPVGACFLTVSLGERFNGYCYKLVAAVIRPS